MFVVKLEHLEREEEEEEKLPQKQEKEEEETITCEFDHDTLSLRLMAVLMERSAMLQEKLVDHEKQIKCLRNQINNKSN